MEGRRVSMGDDINHASYNASTSRLRCTFSYKTGDHVTHVTYRTTLHEIRVSKARFWKFCVDRIIMHLKPISKPLCMHNVIDRMPLFCCCLRQFNSSRAIAGCADGRCILSQYPYNRLSGKSRLRSGPLSVSRAILLSR